MTNPFEDENAEYQVLVNEENQHSLWPTWIEAPTGWSAAFGTAGRQDCLDYIEANWTDIRPASLLGALAR
ncbi:MbtH family protein [Streptacidiphilus albus]|jgi:MbtH protein|uniref:MbtH family protein n=1 Tax=Streptacidiphilus albus TaxID=105425 RepID=UPI00054BE1E6|nr:MbtH family protein [Streptacidiphilus albus]